jgi:hypothetical protein
LRQALDVRLVRSRLLSASDEDVFSLRICHSGANEGVHSLPGIQLADIVHAFTASHSSSFLSRGICPVRDHDDRFSGASVPLGEKALQL